MSAMCEYNRFSKGIFGWIGFKTKWIEYENVNRIAGETSWSFWGLLKYAIDGIINFSETPMSIASGLGMFLTFVSFVMIIFIIIRKAVFGDPLQAGHPLYVLFYSFRDSSFCAWELWENTWQKHISKSKTGRIILLLKQTKKIQNASTNLLPIHKEGVLFEKTD